MGQTVSSNPASGGGGRSPAARRPDTVYVIIRYSSISEFETGTSVTFTSQQFAGLQAELQKVLHYKLQLL